MSSSSTNVMRNAMKIKSPKQKNFWTDITIENAKNSPAICGVFTFVVVAILLLMFRPPIVKKKNNNEISFISLLIWSLLAAAAVIFLCWR